MTTPSWDETAMEIVEILSKRSHCVNYQVAAVAFRGNHLVGIGYNGPPHGFPHCDEVGCAKKDSKGNLLPSGSGKCRGAHAEMNLIVNAAYWGVALNGCRIYCSFSPCSDCAKHLINLGITEFIYAKAYDGSDTAKAFEYFASAGIKIRQFNLKRSEQNG